MSDWRVLGYVPDSDDEEEEYQTNSHKSLRDEAEQINSLPNEATTTHRDENNGQSTTSQLEKTLSHGLQTVRDVLALAPPVTTKSLVTGVDDEDDSPLSSLTPSLASSPTRIAARDGSKSPLIPILSIWQGNESHSNGFLHPRRTLRTRAPIQEHPYMLEDAKYRQLMQDRGLKPVNVPTVSRSGEPARDNEESQQSVNSQILQAEESFDLSDASLSPSASFTYTNIETRDANTTRSQVEPPHQDDDLPDLSQILQDRDPNSKKTYRAKAKRARSMDHLDLARSAVADMVALPEVDGHDSARNNLTRDDQFRVPPSPPLSESHRTVTRESEESEEDIVPSHKKIQNFHTPNALPTPLVSSDREAGKIVPAVISSSESSQSEDGDDSEASLQTEEDDSQGLQWIRQKLRGVLPPSFLKLNQQSLIQTQSRQRPLQPQTSTSNERGVARRTKARTSKASIRSPNHNLQLIELDSSDSESSSTRKMQVEDTSMSPTPPVIIEDNGANEEPITFDIPEEDVIDRMLPSTRVQRGPTVTKRRRQKRIDHGWALIDRGLALGDDTGGSVHQRSDTNKARTRKTTNTKRRKTKHKSQQRPISVLDAPDLSSVARQSQPQFLKLAARQARRAAHPIRQNSTKKFFAMATDADTQDVNKELQAWFDNGRRRGQPAIVAGPDAAVHRQLDDQMNPTSGKSTTQPTSPVNVANLKQSTSALLSRISIRAKGSRASGAFSDSQVPVPTPDNNSSGQLNHLRSLFTHRNRSGKGQLLSRLPDPRAAQIEGSMSKVMSLTSIPIRSVARSDERRPTNLSEMLSRTDDKDSSHSFPKPVTKRKPRKQLPKPRMPPKTGETPSTAPVVANMENDHHAATVPGRKMTSHKHTDHWLETRITAVVNVVRSLQLPPPDTIFAAGSVVGDQHLRIAKRNFYQKQYASVVRTTQLAPISTPISLQLVPCGEYSSQVQATIATVFAEVTTVISEASAEVHIGPRVHERCDHSLASVVNYFDTSVCFRDAYGINEIIDTVYSCIERCVNTLDISDDKPSIESRDGQLKCLNWFVVIVVYLLTFAKNASRDLDRDTVTNIQTLWHRITTTILKIVFDRRFLETSLRRLSSIFDQSLSIRSTIVSFPEADAVVLMWHTSDIVTDKHPSAEMYKQVESVMHSYENVALDQLQQNILALCFVLPLVTISEEGDASHIIDKTNDVHSICFGMLAKCVQDVVKHVTFRDAPASVGRLMEAVEDLCLKIVRNWGWHPTPAIVKAIREAYASNGWLPFHTIPDSDDVFRHIDFGPFMAWNDGHNDFYKFLELLKLCMKSLCRPAIETTDRARNKAAGQVRGLVYALLPNSSGSLDARKSIHADQFLALKNCFALYVVLTTSAPDGFQPRLDDLKYMVDFSTSHSHACKVAIAAWKAIGIACVQSFQSVHGTLTAINAWMDSMLHQSVKYFEVYHQLDAMVRLEDLLSTVTLVIQHSDTEAQARQLIRAPTFDTVRLLLNNPAIHRNNQRVTIAGLGLLQAYADKTLANPVHDTLLAEVQLILKNVIQQTLSSGTVYDARLLRQLMSAWFAVAQAMVRTFHKHWNDFVDPHSNLSIDFLSGLRTSYTTYEVKECFYSDLIQADQAYFFLECRPIVFMTWVATLLLPVQAMRFEHVLTNAILKKESDSLMIRDLAAQLFSRGNARDLTLQEVADSRIVILRHIIQNVYGQQKCPEEEWLAGGLDSTALKDLLRTMTKTMKANWLDLKRDPVAQSSYTALVHAILNEMETYPVPGFKIDSWFSGSYEFPRPAQTLDNIFKCRFEEKGDDITKDSIYNFQTQYTRELEEGREFELVQELLRVFHCTDPLRARSVNGQRQYSVDIAKQARFIQLVFPAYIESGARHRESLIMFPILDLLIQLTSKIQFRIDNLDPEHMRLHTTAIAAVLCAVRKCMESTHAQHIATRHLLEYTRVATASLFTLLEYGIEIDEDIVQAYIGNVLGIYTVVREHLPALLNTAVRRPMSATIPQSEPEEFLIRDVVRSETVYDCWRDAPERDLDLVPLEMRWTLFSEATEPELSPDERALRAFALEGLKRWEGLLAPPGERTWKAQEVTEAMLALVRELQDRDLVVDTDMDSEEEEWDENW